MSTFKVKYEFAERVKVSSNVLSKYKDRIPIIVERAPRAKVPDLAKHKYICPIDITVGQFLFQIRKHIKLEQDQAIFLFVSNLLPPSSASLGAIYERYKDDDGFLYMSYTGENTFGFS